MPKKFLNRIKESMSGGGQPKGDTSSKKTDLKSVSDAINSVKSWDQLEVSKNLIINFIKKHKVRSESPEYKYVLRLYKLRKQVLSANRMVEGDDDIERLRSIIKLVITESLNWEDRDENWDTDNSYWGTDDNWVQGDAGGSSDSGDSFGDSGGDYDSFMGEDGLEWMDNIQPRKDGEVRVGDIYNVGNGTYPPSYVVTITSVSHDEVCYEIMENNNGNVEDDEEPVGSIHCENPKLIKRLIIEDEYWQLASNEY
jgi:hypothetical protein